MKKIFWLILVITTFFAVTAFATTINGTGTSTFTTNISMSTYDLTANKVTLTDYSPFNYETLVYWANITDAYTNLSQFTDDLTHSDLNVSSDSGSGTILDNEAFTVAGGGIVSTSMSGNTLTITGSAHTTNTQKGTTGPYLYNDSTNIILNETYLNSTIDARDDDTTYTTVGTYVLLTGTQFSFNDSRMNATIDARDDDTTYTASGTLLDLTGTVFSVNEGTLTNTKWCKYTSGTGLDCDVEPVTDTNETTRVNDLNTSKADIGDCASGKYVQNTTSTGVECGTPPDTNTNAGTVCSGTTTYLDGEGACDDISSVYIDVAGDSFTGNVNMSNNNITNVNVITATSLIGALTGNADTATNLASNPTDCSANQFADAIAASGDLTCNAIIDADVPNTITIDLATTATALAGNGANCNAGEYALGVDASGAVESCTDATTEINTVVATKDECSEITNCVANAWDADADISIDTISESKIAFSTACASGNHYYLSGNDLACEADANTNADTVCSGTTTYLDGEGACDDISSVYADQGANTDITSMTGITGEVKTSSFINHTITGTTRYFANGCTEIANSTGMYWTC